MSLLWHKVASKYDEVGHDCPGGMDHFDWHACTEGMVKVRHGEHEVMAIRHAHGVTSLYASHLPHGDPDHPDRSSVGEGMIDGNVVHNVGVAPEHQRKGIAKLWGAAVHHMQQRGEHPPVVASHERTDKGEAAMQGLGIPSEGPRKVVYKSERA